MSVCDWILCVLRKISCRIIRYYCLYEQVRFQQHTICHHHRIHHPTSSSAAASSPPAIKAQYNTQQRLFCEQHTNTQKKRRRRNNRGRRRRRITIYAHAKSNKSHEIVRQQRVDRRYTRISKANTRRARDSERDTSVEVWVWVCLCVCVYKYLCQDCRTARTNPRNCRRSDFRLMCIKYRKHCLPFSSAQLASSQCESCA